MAEIDHRKTHFCKLILVVVCGALPGIGYADEDGVAFDSIWGPDNHVEIAIATGSPGELGLLKALAQAYISYNPVSVGWIKAGSGKSLRLLKDGVVDLALVHAPQAEQAAIAEGWVAQRTLIGANTFYLVGPESDPAKVRNATTIIEAYRRISVSRSAFISRGDNSGTHQREQQIWDLAGITPSGDWYISSNTFMLDSLKMAVSHGAYFMTDSSTWIASKPKISGLEVLFSGEPLLVNHYHALLGKNTADVCRDFFRFLGSTEAQSIIAGFGKDDFDEPLYLGASQAEANN